MEYRVTVIRKQVLIVLVPLLLFATVTVFFQNCGKNFEAVDLSSTALGVPESDPSLLQGKFIEVHVDPIERTSKKVSFFILQADSGDMYLLDKSNYPAGAFDSIKKNSSVTIRLANESIGKVLLSKNQSEKINATSGGRLKPEQVISLGPPSLTKIKGYAIYQNLPKDSSLVTSLLGKNLFNKQNLNEKTMASGDADLNVAVVVMKFKTYTSGSLSEFEPNVSAYATDKAIKQMNKNSYNKIRMHFDKDKDAYLLDLSGLGDAGSYEGCENWVSYSEQAIRYAVAQETNKKKKYHRVVTILPAGSSDRTKACGWAGITDGGEYDELDRIPHLVSRGGNTHTIAHELGHTLNLGHSGAQNMNDPYADNYDVMGRGDFFNGAKLLDLNIFKLNSGLEFVPEGSNSIFEIYSKDRDPSTAPGKPYLYVLGSYVISFAPSYGGVAIHTFNGEGHFGNPSSKVIKILKNPGEEWKSDNNKYRVAFKSLDLINDKAEVGFNNADVGSGVIIGGCKITNFSPTTSLSPDLLRSGIKQELNGHLTISYVMSDFNFVGSCDNERIGIQVESTDGVMSFPDGIFKFAMDLKTKPTTRASKYIKIPYHLNSNRSASAAIRLRFFHYNKNNETNFYEISNIEQALYFNNIGCGNMSNCNDDVNKCDASPSLTHVFDKFVYSSNETASGYLIVANNNDPSCGGRWYQLDATAYKTGIKIADFISFGDSLPVVQVSNNVIVKSIFINGGSAVYLPIQIINKSPIDTSDFYIATTVTARPRLYYSVSFINLNGLGQTHWGSSNINGHPYHPVMLSNENFSGPSSTTTSTTSSTTTSTTKPVSQPGCGTVVAPGTGLNPGVGSIGSACRNSSFIPNSLGFDPTSGKWMWRCLGSGNNNEITCYTDLHEAVCNNAYTGTLVDGQPGGGCGSGYLTSYSKITNGSSVNESWYCGDNSQVTDRHFEQSSRCSRSITTTSSTSTTTTTRPQDLMATCGAASGDRVNSLYSAITRGSVTAANLCGEGSEFISSNPYSFYPTAIQMLSDPKVINVDTGPWDWRCRNKISQQTIICRSQRTDIKPCSYYSGNNYSKLGDYRTKIGCASLSQQYCDDTSVRWHLDNLGIKDGFCSADPRMNPTY
jgi:hypothetical protein